MYRYFYYFRKDNYFILSNYALLIQEYGKDLNEHLLYKIKYTNEAIKGMMEKRLDRVDALRNLNEALDGKLLSFYGMLEYHYHVISISKVPEYANSNAGIVNAMMANTLENYKVILYMKAQI